MSSRLGDRLSSARRHRFVGRDAELSLFQSALTAAEVPFYVLHIFGPGGVGKTSLLQAFDHTCASLQIPTMLIDGRNIEPRPDAFLDALRTTLDLPSSSLPLEFLATQPRRRVLLIDTYELLQPLDRWLRQVFLPDLPEQTLVVLAGRQPPSPGWRADPGWQALLQTISLRNLTPAEGRTYLTQRGIPTDEHQAILAFTHSHPLALSLVADIFAQRGDTRFEPQTDPDIIKILLERLIDKAPSPIHRLALQACAMVRITTEALLAEMLDVDDSHELFEWLRKLSFIESGRQGILPHDLAREVLLADLRWRNPDTDAELHRRARAYYNTRLPEAGGQSQQALLIDYIFLHRDNPVIRPFFMALRAQRQEDQVNSDVPQPTDWPVLLAMVERHEGAESAKLAAHWFERQPDNVMIFRNSSGEAVGFLLRLALHQAEAAELLTDPATAAAWQYLSHYAPLRPGEGATHFRFWMASETYQMVSPIMSLIGVNIVRHFLTTPGLAFTFFPSAMPDFWAPIFAYTDFARLSEAAFEVDGRSYGVYGHDWRATPPTAWLDLLADREISTTAQLPPSPPAAERLLVLSRPEFEAAVREALRELALPDGLQHNPLLRARLVMGQPGAETEKAAQPDVLRSLLKEVVNEMAAAPRRLKYHRALYHTYFQPAQTQSQAAELLDLPFSTYRRHLTTGIEQVVEVLWQWETGHAEK